MIVVLPQSPIYQKYGTGTTVFSALAGGLLTGKVYTTPFYCILSVIEVKYLIPSSVQ